VIDQKELVDEIRFEIARQMLEDTAMPVSRIAAMLDYADASALHWRRRLIA